MWIIALVLVPTLRIARLEPTELHRRLGLVCLAVGHEVGMSPQIRDRVLDEHVLMLVDGGGGSVSVADGPWVDVPPSTLLWLPARVRHSFGPGPGGWAKWWVNIDGVAPLTDLGLFGPAGPGPVSPGEVRRPFERLLTTCLRPDDGHRSVTAAMLTYQVFLAAARSRSATARDQEVMLAHLRRNAFGDRTIAALAHDLSLTVPQLRDAVRAATGTTPKHYILDARLAEARTLLSGTQLPIARIATRVGYDDAGYFSRLFSRYVGVSPTAFREQCLHTSVDAAMHTARGSSSNA